MHVARAIMADIDRIEQKGGVVESLALPLDVQHQIILEYLASSISVEGLQAPDVPFCALPSFQGYPVIAGHAIQINYHKDEE